MTPRRGWYVVGPLYRWVYSSDATGVARSIELDSHGGVLYRSFRPAEVKHRRVPMRLVPRTVRERLAGSAELAWVKKDKARAWGRLRRQRWAREGGQ
jgi:hypothetical protein